MILDKAMRTVAALVVTGIVGLLLLAWRDHEKVDLDDRLAALFTVCCGLLFGVGWELVEFTIDWIVGLQLQASNLDTMTDLLWNNVGAVIAGTSVVWLYCRVIDYAARARIGRVAVWLVDGPRRLHDRHGFLVTIVVALVAAATVGALWFAGRPLPGLAIA